MARPPQTSPLKPRKQPSQPRAEKTVAALLEAAAQVLERDGLEGFNTNAVARRAGVSIGSLYQYFPGKDALILALMRREGERFYAEAAHALDMPTGAEGLRALIAAAVRQQLERPTLARLLDVEETRPALRAEKEGGVLERVLQQILERPDLPRQPDVALAAHDLMAMVASLTDTAGERGELDVPHLERRIHAAVFGYLDRMESAQP